MWRICVIVLLQTLQEGSVENTFFQDTDELCVQ